MSVEKMQHISVRYLVYTAPITDHFLSADTIEHTTQHLVQQMLTNIMFSHRQLPKALDSLCYETSAKADIWVKK